MRPSRPFAAPALLAQAALVAALLALGPVACDDDERSDPDGHLTQDGAAQDVPSGDADDTAANDLPDGTSMADTGRTDLPDGTPGDTSASDTSGTDVVEPPPTGCERLPRVELTGATEVATEAELRAALAAGGAVRLTADLVASAPLPITLPTVFDGGGHTLSGGGTTHLFVVTRTTATIQNVTLRDANNQVDDSEHFSRRSGAAIMASGSAGPGIPTTGSLQVIDVVFEQNRIKASGPGDLRGGALYGFAMPDLTVSGCTFRGNVGSNGGAIGGLGASFRIIDTTFDGNRTNGTGPGGALEGHGGAISLDALSQNGQTAYLDLCGARFLDNEAANGGGALYLVTHWQTGSTVTIAQSLFQGNRNTSTSEGQGGAIFLMDDDKHAVPAQPVANSARIVDSAFVDNQVWGQGGGVWYWTSDGRLTLRNVTFHSNRTLLGTTGMGGALAASRGPVDVVNCTFSENWARFHGGGIQAGTDATITLQNTLFYNNTSNRDGGWANFHSNRAADVDAGGNLQFLDPSLVIDGNSDALVSANATRGQDPLLGALTDNGGPTPTRALLTGSPAIDAGVATGAPTTDQRGEPRDAAPDIGAYEASP